MVFYRKYRPQIIDDLDNTQIREKISALLANAISKKNDIPHAFLFTGPKGLGKTSTARLIAKAVNCERNAFSKVNDEQKVDVKNSKLNTENEGAKLEISTSNLHLPISNIEPCNMCGQCIAITNGNNLDVMEIDAASNRGIDEIRELKEKINLSPVQSRKKIYIIDEVHMLTTEAFNALLKTLEEPPAHALFMLCTTEEHKIPSTIISRCFHLQFASATPDELKRSLQRIIVGEKIKIEPLALEMIAKYADGGFRDGTKLLEEAVALCGDDGITVDLIENKLHIGGIAKSAKEFLALLKQGKTKSALDFIERLVQEKVDLVYFTQGLLSLLHEQFLIILEAKEITGDNLTLSEIKDLVSLFSQAYRELKSAYLPQLPLEIAVVEWEDRNKKVGQASSEINHKHDKKISLREEVGVEEQPGVKQVLKHEDEITVSHLRKQVGAMAKIKALYGEDSVAKPKPVEENNITTHSVSLLHFSVQDEMTPEWLDLFWKSIISEMKNYNHTIAGVLRSCKIKEFDRKTLTIEAAYQFHKDKLGEAKTMTNLEEICKGLLGGPVVVNVVLRDS